jgi:hypothetical protein
VDLPSRESRMSGDEPEPQLGCVGRLGAFFILGIMVVVLMHVVSVL